MGPGDDTLALKAGALSAEITGGDLLSVRSLSLDGAELLVAPAELPTHYRVHDTRAGITLLHPWANRLASDSYRFAGREGRLDGAGSRITRDAHGLAIHGLRAPVPWSLRQLGADRAEAVLTWPEEPAFPFAHRISVSFALSRAPGPNGAGADDDERRDTVGGGALTVVTQVIAEGPSPVPIAWGWHPYFRCERASGAVLDLPRLRHLEADADGIPTGRQTTWPAGESTLSEQSLDDGLAGFVPGTRLSLTRDHHTITVAWGDGYAYGQIFAPDDAPIVSLEPMTAPTDALQHSGRVPVARPGEPFEAVFSVEVAASSVTV